MLDRAERLLRVGYLPAQLPPPLHSRDLADNYAALLAAWKALDPKPPKGAWNPKAPRSKPELFSVARVGHKRRATSITNPVAQTFLAQHVADRWGDFVAHYRKSRLSASHPRFLRHASRATSIPSMHLLYDRKISMAAGYRYMLKTDVSRFFPTIYTHSVPWALHTKAVAKKKTSPTGRYFGNLIDLAVRQGQDGQTIGIPIGPDTSHIVAELIATSVDLELKKRLKTWPAGFRYVDDYFLFFESKPEAENALAALVRSLNDFELQINFEKTATCSVIAITEDFWPHKLRSFEVAAARRRQLYDVHHFFELAKDLAVRNTDESVMVYALKRVSSTVIRKECWDAFEAHVCHVALAYPNTLQHVARIFSTYQRVGYPLKTARLSRLVNALIEDHAPLGHHSEVAWSLWMVKDLGLALSSENVDRLSEVHSSVCALLLLDLEQSGRLPKPPKRTYWKGFESVEALHGDLWLLSYEAGVRGWGGLSDAHVQADPYFELLRQRNVRFYEIGASVSPLFSVKPDAVQRFQAASEAGVFDHDEIEDFDDLVDFDDDEGGYEGAVLAAATADDFDDLRDDENPDPLAGDYIA